MAFWNENQADFNNPRMGQQPAMSLQGPADGGGSGGPRQGFMDYLETQGWNGEGRPFQYAQQLRQQGQHPWMDYWRSMHPNAGQNMGQGGGMQGGLGGQFGGLNFPQWTGQHMPRPPDNGGAYGGWQNPTPPRPMNPTGIQPQGIAVGEPNGGLVGMFDQRKRPGMFTPR